MMKKLFVGLMVGAVSAASLAADWRAVPSAYTDPKIAIDWESVKSDTHQLSYDEEMHYLEMKVRKVFSKPQTLKSGKYYTDETYMLSVDCENKQYAITDYEWFINKNKIAENKQIAWSAAWEDFKPVPRVYAKSPAELKNYKQIDITSSFICNQMVG